MRTQLTALAVAVLVTVGLVHAQAVWTDAQFTEVMKLSHTWRGTKNPLIVSPDADGFFTNPWYTVFVRGPMAQAIDEAQSAAHELRPFTKAQIDIDPDSVLIGVRPNTPKFYQGRWHVSPLVDRVVIVPGKNDQSNQHIIEAAHAEKVPAHWANAFGMTADGQGMTATFRLSDLPKGEFDIVVVGEGAEPQRYHVSEKDRRKIR